MKNLKYLLLITVLFTPFIAKATTNDGTCATDNTIYLSCPTLTKGTTTTCNVIADISGTVVSGETKTGNKISGAQFTITSDEFEISNAVKADFIYGDITETENGYKISLSADQESAYKTNVTIAKVDVTIPEDATATVFNYNVTGTDSGNDDEYIILNNDGLSTSYHAYDTCGKLSISSNNTSDNSDNTTNNNTTTNPATGISTTILVLGVTIAIVSGAVIINKKNKALY